MSKQNPSPLGKLPENWNVVQLKEITEKIKSGATPKGGESSYLPSRERFALIRSQNVFDRRFDETGLAFISDEQAGELSGAEVHLGDALLNITGDGITFARSTLAPEHVLPACVNQHVMLIRPRRDKCVPGFLLCYLTHPRIKDYIESFNAGGSRRAITKGNIESFVIPLPPLPQQRAIASVLGTLDDKIELNRRMNETLEALAQSLFKSWFVPACRSLGAGRDATQSSLPKGWRESTVDEEFNLTMGQSPPGETYNEIGNGIPFFQGKTDFGFRFPTARVYCTAPTRFANAGDTLVSVRAPVGSVNMATEKCSIGRGVAAVRHKSGSRSYTYYLMRSLEADFACFEAEGTVFGSINKADFHAIRRAAPPFEVVEAFEKMLFPIDQRIENNEKESRTLAALRDTLLPKLLSGELRLPAQMLRRAGVHAVAQLLEAKI